MARKKFSIAPRSMVDGYDQASISSFVDMDWYNVTITQDLQSNDWFFLDIEKISDLATYLGFYVRR